MRSLVHMTTIFLAVTPCTTRAPEMRLHLTHTTVPSTLQELLPRGPSIGFSLCLRPFLVSLVCIRCSPPLPEQLPHCLPVAPQTAGDCAMQPTHPAGIMRRIALAFFVYLLAASAVAAEPVDYLRDIKPL